MALNIKPQHGYPYASLFFKVTLRVNKDQPNKTASALQECIDKIIRDDVISAEMVKITSNEVEEIQEVRVDLVTTPKVGYEIDRIRKYLLEIDNVVQVNFIKEVL